MAIQLDWTREVWGTMNRAQWSYKDTSRNPGEWYIWHHRVDDHTEPLSFWLIIEIHLVFVEFPKMYYIWCFWNSTWVPGWQQHYIFDQVPEAFEPFRTREHHIEFPPIDERNYLDFHITETKLKTEYFNTWPL